MAPSKFPFVVAVAALSVWYPSFAADIPQQDTAAADAQFFAGHFESAKMLYSAVPPTSQKYEEALRRLGAIALSEKRLADAEQELNLALAQTPADTKAQSLMAEIASRRGDFAHAASWLAKAGKPERAAAFAAFGQSRPYRIVSAGSPLRVPFVQTDPVPAVLAKVNGAEGLFLVDTGGAEIVLDSGFAKSADVEVAGSGNGTFAGGKTSGLAYGRIAKFTLNSLEVADVPAMLLSTKGFSGAATGKPVAGVIGTAFLSRFLATIDYPAGALSLEPSDTSPPPYLIAVPFWLAGDHYIVARGRLDSGADQLFLVDTGLAGFAFTAPASTLKDAAVPIPVPQASPSSSEVGQSAVAPFAIDALSLGDLHAKNLTGLYGPFPPSLEAGLGVHLGGIVSHAFFRPYAVTFDFVHMKIYLRKPST
jgi:aspartyl protease